MQTEYPWPMVELGELCSEVTVGFVGSMASEYCTVGVPFIRSLNVKPFRIERAEIKFVSPEFHTKIRKSRLRAGDVVIVRTGVPGTTAVVPEWLDGGNCSDLVIARPNDRLDAGFLCYFMNAVAHHVGRMYAVGAVQQHFNVGAAKTLKIPLPPLPEQRAIAAVLGALDDKIEVNRKTARVLEGIARAVFTSWFVDFDPVRRAAAGQPTGLPAALAALFPKHLVDSHIGEVPEGWRVGTIDSLCDSISSGGTPARMNKDYWEGGTIPWFKTGELFDAPLFDSEEQITNAALANSSCKLWPAGTILFALYASPTVGRMGVLTRPGTSNQAAAGLIVKPEYGVPFLLNALFFARGKLQQIAVGAAQQNINQGVLKAHQVVVPAAGLAQRFSQLMTPALEKQAQLSSQSATLSALRDALLPKLISGELRIADAELMMQSQNRSTA